MKNKLTIPEYVYENIPKLFRSTCSNFKEPHERDMFFVALLGLLGACFPNVKSIYDNRTQFPFINVFIIAKAGIGKSVIMFARYAIEGIVTEFDKITDQIASSDVTKFPRSLIIPGNISAAAFMSQLDANGGSGVIFETEADTYSNGNDRDWGKKSDDMRKIFHHEPLSLTRKKDNESIKIPTPKLGMVLSGTPNQIEAVIPNIENGAYTRFIFYTANPILNFRDGRPKPGSVNLEQLFKTTISDQFVAIYNYFQNKEITVVFTDPQWDLLTSHWRAIFEKIKHKYEDYTGVIFRHSAITLRIGMILSIVRAKENNTDLSSDLICTDQDFNSALQITSTLEKHAHLIYDFLPKNNKTKSIDYIDKLLDKLPQGENITRKEIIEKWGIPERTADARIKKFIESGQLIYAEYGTYQLPPTNDNTFFADSAKSAETADSLVLVNNNIQTA